MSLHVRGSLWALYRLRSGVSLVPRHADRQPFIQQLCFAAMVIGIVGVMGISDEVLLFPLAFLLFALPFG